MFLKARYLGQSTIRRTRSKLSGVGARVCSSSTSTACAAPASAPVTSMRSEAASKRASEATGVPRRVYCSKCSDRPFWSTMGPSWRRPAARNGIPNSSTW